LKALDFAAIDVMQRVPTKTAPIASNIHARNAVRPQPWQWLKH
jgi:hypothetical protein